MSAVVVNSDELLLLPWCIGYILRHVSVESGLKAFQSNIIDSVLMLLKCIGFHMFALYEAQFL
jgi:hypothetical protein